MLRRREGIIRIVAQNVENMTSRGGLHRVWELAYEGDRTRLVARWINPGAEDLVRTAAATQSIATKRGSRGFVSVAIRLVVAVEGLVIDEEYRT